MIKLVKDTISKGEIDSLINWLETDPRLTKGDLTVEYEKQWSEKIGCKHSVFVNSGSSAILISLYALIANGTLKKGDSVIVPALAWATDLSPVVQLGLKPILCDCNMEDLSVDPHYLRSIVSNHKPKALILVSVLGLVPDMDFIVNFCEDNDIVLIEDACESLGSKYKGKNLGNFGLLSCFSTYYGHHISTIEGGMVCTNDDELYNLLKSLRSHGWDRDMDPEYSKELKETFNINDDFDSLYKFYYFGFNLRSTDLQAFIGINQLDRLSDIISKRNSNYNLYRGLLSDYQWQPPASTDENYISNFAYPIIHPNRNEIIKKLKKQNIESRPLICGSMGKQPFWIKNFGSIRLPHADHINDFGLYLPNNHQLEEEEINFIAETIKDI